MTQANNAEKGEESGAGRLLSRRNIIRGAGATVLAPGFATAAIAQTGSGSIELDTSATVPTSTTIDITVYEDTDGDGTAENQETNSVGDGSDTVVYDTLTGEEGDAYTYWLDVELATTDDTVTPELDTVVIVLPATGQTTQEPTTEAPSGETGTPDDPQTIGELWQNYQAFVALIVLAYTAIGTWSKSLTVGAWAGYLAFLYLGLNSSNELFRGIALVTLVLTFLGMAFKLVRLELDADR